jgi:FtsP/CotA-like multicopper oxidase with cupredoxin domain
MFLPAHGTARIAVHFDDRPGDWMFHCHILDHAEIGMMGVLRVLPAR